MNKIVEKVLTDKSARSSVALSALALSSVVVMTPWSDVAGA